MFHCCYLALLLQPNILQGVTKADMLIWLWKQPQGHFLYLGVLGGAMLLMLLKHGTNNKWWLTRCSLVTPYVDKELVQHWPSINWAIMAWYLFNANPWSKPVMTSYISCFRTLLDKLKQVFICDVIAMLVQAVQIDKQLIGKHCCYLYLKFCIICKYDYSTGSYWQTNI